MLLIFEELVRIQLGTGDPGSGLDSHRRRNYSSAQRACVGMYGSA